MSISIPGTLQVIRRTGKNGDFSVGELITDIGRFRVKHKVLDEFEQGSCKGVFVITEVFNVISTTKSGQIWGNLCADLDWDFLKVMAQTEPVYVPSKKQESGQLAKCMIRLKELGGDYEDE